MAATFDAGGNALIGQTRMYVFAFPSQEARQLFLDENPLQSRPISGRRKVRVAGERRSVTAETLADE